MSHQLPSEQWICFQIADETYAHPVANVQEILNFRQPVPVPGAPNEVEGILNIRGEIVTVLSSRRLLNLDEGEPHQTEHIVIMQTETGAIGVMVDQVKQIENLNRDHMELLDAQTNSPVRGTIQHDQGLLILTDFTRCIGQFDRDV